MIVRLSFALRVFVATLLLWTSTQVFAGVYFIHADHLGTPVAVTSLAGATVWQATIDPFGTANVTISTVTMNLRLPGQYFDAETGIHYNYFRDYDPAVGRYLQSDPIGLAGGFNTYAYVNSNPLRWIDPFGLAYFAKRRLSGMPWFEPGSNNPGSIDDRRNTEISHEHLFFEDGKAPPNIGFGDKGLFFEVSEAGYTKTDGGYNDCVMRIAVERTPEGKYCLLGDRGSQNNCQDWADRVRRKYGELLHDPLIKTACECK